MGILGRSIASTLLFASACYSPDLRDCTVSCTAANDCASGQVCGSDRFCASPELAGRCGSLPTDDGGTPIPPTDAGVIVDGESVTPPDAPPDAPMTKQLHIKVDGQGGISVLGVGTCDSAPPQNGDCRFDVFLATPLHAEGYGHPGWRFDKWTDGPCQDDHEDSCNFTPTGPTNLNAKFRRDD
jgi:hypothetical protein